jgi:hypothetical protein
MEIVEQVQIVEANIEEPLQSIRHWRGATERP